MITIKNLSISYNSKKQVIDMLSLSLAENTIHGIVGLNGTGKTTLLNTIYGLKNADSGEINWKESELSKKQMSYLQTENFFYSNITGSEYLSLFKNENFVESKWNTLFSLPLEKIIDEYSTGMKKKLALLATLKQDKEIMILDEPFNGLDIETSRTVRTILLRLKEKGKTILITSHIIETLTNLCDQIHYLESGKIKYSREKKDFPEFEQELFTLIENKNEEIISELIV
jgi:ABC-2 type transport system ATP-binding protein